MSVVIALALFTAAGSARATTADEEDALIRHGIQLRKARDDLAARAEFQKAYDLTHSPRAAAQLGLAEFALGRWEDAEAHVSEALRAPKDPWIAKYRVELDTSLATIKTHVARIEVIGEPTGAEVFVNGRSAGRLPLANPVAVSEGQVDVELRAPGFTRGSRTVTLSGGQYQRLVMRLEPVTALMAAAPPAGADRISRAPAPGSEDGTSLIKNAGSLGPGDGDTPSTVRTVAKWTALGLAGAALATGITATIVYQKKTTEFEDRGCYEFNGGVVDAGGRPFPACQPFLDASQSARTWQWVGFIGAGVFATTWLTLLLTEPKHPDSTVASESQASVTRTWQCAPTMSDVGAACMLRF